jgi:hypothetical protein
MSEYEKKCVCETACCSSKAVDDQFVKELENCINRNSMENGSDTPDFILAEFLSDCLKAWNKAVKNRKIWYGESTGPCACEE